MFEVSRIHSRYRLDIDLLIGVPYPLPYPLSLPPATGEREAVPERRVREAAKVVDWGEQQIAWQELKKAQP